MIYLDCNATTPLAKEVLEEISSVLKRAWANPSSCHENGLLAKQIIEKSREQVANMISCDPQEITFTSGGTESNNIILHSAVRHFSSGSNVVKSGASWKERDRGEQFPIVPHVISSNQEHDSVKLTLQHFLEAGIAEVSYVPSCHTSGCVDVERLFSMVQTNTCLITVMLANNESGIIQPVSEIGSRLLELNRERSTRELPPIYLHTDAAQAIGKIPVDVDRLNVHYLTIVGHKFYGPRIGALFARGAPLLPMFYGGGQERNIRPGTPNTGMIAGLGKACELVTLNLTKYQSHMKSIRDYLEEQLQQAFPGMIHINGRFESSRRIPNTCNVSIIGQEFKGNMVLAAVKSFEASVGAACHSDRSNIASPILLSIGVPENVALNALRLSVGRETSAKDVDRVVLDLKEVVTCLSSKSSSTILMSDLV